MTDDVWREFFGSSAPLHRNEVSTATSVRAAASIAEGPDPAPGLGRRPA